MQSRTNPPGTGTNAQLLGRARVLLGDVSTWRLPSAAWSRPDTAVAALAEAIASGDMTAVGAAIGRLEVLSPHRAQGIADPDDVPAPEPLQERITALLHTIAPPGEPIRGEDVGNSEQH